MRQRFMAFRAQSFNLAIMNLMQKFTLIGLATGALTAIAILTC
jgi:hypothetical protein